MLRSPNATVTTSKWLSGNGIFSASQSSDGVTTPLSSSRSRPTRSIDSLMSVCQTSPVGPAAFANARVRSPVPAAMSSTL